MTASTGMDALAHAIEVYTSRNATPITDGLALHAMQLVKKYIIEAVNNCSSNKEAREKMLSASLMAGAAFGNSNVGSVHCLSEAIGGLYDAPHGILNAIFPPYVLENNIEANIERHADIAYALSVNKDLPLREAAKKGGELLFKIAEEVGISTFSELPTVNPDDFLHLAKVAKETPMDANNVKNMSEEVYLRMLKSTYK